jgi:hypothetical protein
MKEEKVSLTPIGKIKATTKQWIKTIRISQSLSSKVRALSIILAIVHSKDCHLTLTKKWQQILIHNNPKLF